MESKKVIIYTEYITLSQFLKFTSLVDSGAMAKEYIFNHKILVNGEDVKQRGKKLRNKDLIKIDDSLLFEIKNDN